MKKTVGFIIILVMAVFCSFTVCAVGDAPADYTVTASRPQVGVGDTVTINITITAVKAIGRTSASVTYDTSALTFVSGNGATDQGGVINIELPNGLGTTAVLSLNFTANTTGSASVNVTKCCIYDAFEEGYDIQESKGVSVDIAEKAETTTTEETTPTSPQTDAFARIKQNKDNDSRMFISLLNNAEFKEQFALTMLDLGNYNLTSDKADKLITEKLNSLERIIQKCQSRNIKVYVCFPPEYFHFKKQPLPCITAVKNLCERKAIPCFVDYDDPDFLSKPELFSDNIHLNKYGAAIYTNKIISRIPH